jgi:hypothetical protein
MVLIDDKIIRRKNCRAIGRRIRQADKELVTLEARSEHNKKVRIESGRRLGLSVELAKLAFVFHIFDKQNVV